MQWGSDPRQNLLVVGYYYALDPGRSIRHISQRAKHDIVADLLDDLTDSNLLILKAAIDDLVTLLVVQRLTYEHIGHA